MHPGRRCIPNSRTSRLGWRRACQDVEHGGLPRFGQVLGPAGGEVVPEAEQERDEGECEGERGQSGDREGEQREATVQDRKTEQAGEPVSDQCAATCRWGPF